MTEAELKHRTKQFALRVLTMVEALPSTVSGRAIGAQLIRSGTSVGANYRAACRGRSRADGVLLHGDGDVKRSGTARDAVEGESFRVPGNGRKDEHFVARLGIVEEESDESAYWMELIMESGLLPENRVHPLHQEANELTAIVATSIKTARLKTRK